MCLGMFQKCKAFQETLWTCYSCHYILKTQSSTKEDKVKMIDRLLNIKTLLLKMFVFLGLLIFGEISTSKNYVKVRDTFEIMLVKGSHHGQGENVPCAYVDNKLVGNELFSHLNGHVASLGLISMHIHANLLTDWTSSLSSSAFTVKHEMLRLANYIDIP